VPPGALNQLDDRLRRLIHVARGDHPCTAKVLDRAATPALATSWKLLQILAYITANPPVCVQAALRKHGSVTPHGTCYISGDQGASPIADQTTLATDRVGLGLR
jgi:hypothetical protein